MTVLVILGNRDLVGLDHRPAPTVATKEQANPELASRLGEVPAQVHLEAVNGDLGSVVSYPEPHSRVALGRDVAVDQPKLAEGRHLARFGVYAGRRIGALPQRGIARPEPIQVTSDEGLLAEVEVLVRGSPKRVEVAAVGSDPEGDR